MDVISVETRVTISPAIAGHFQWEGSLMSFIPDEPWPEGGEVTFVLEAGSRSNTFLPILRTHRWTFQIGVPRIIYLWPADEPADLYARTFDDGDTTRLTETELGVLDFSVSDDASWVIYSIMREDGGSNLRIFDLIEGEDRELYVCPSGWRCQEAKLSPDFREVAFEQIPLDDGPGGKPLLGEPHIWKISVEANPEAFSIGDPNHTTTSPSWTPKGLLAFYDQDEEQFYVVETLGGSQTVVQGRIPSELGKMGTWSRDGAFLVFPDLVILDESYERYDPTGDEFPLFFSHLYRQGVTTGLIEDLSGEGSELVEDTSPVYSPAGMSIAFTRKYLQGELWTQGRQIWIMDADGQEAQQITDEAMFNHSELSWGPEGAKLAFVKTNQVDLAADPEIWIYDMELDLFTQISSGGTLPKWIQ
jgi:Tol biopolymer transport system component